MTELALTETERRIALANQIKGLDDVALSRLRFWNYEACDHHKEVGPQVDCIYRKCGGELFAHQRVGTAWLYAIKKGLLADDPGVGKTSQILALIALLKERNELRRRAIVIPNTPAVGQWSAEIARWIPGVRTLTVDSSYTQDQRVNAYSTPWECLVIGSHLLLRDYERLQRLGPFDLVVNDDVDPLLDHDNATHRAIVAISEGAERAFTVNATTLQIRLQQIHAAFEPLEGIPGYPLLPAFESRYVRTEMVRMEDGSRKRKPMGWKNLPELKERIGPRYLRRKATELHDIRMPDIMPIHVEWLEMSQTQRARYEELQAGVVRLIRDEGERVKHATALTKFMYGQQICAGLPALGEPDVPGASPKLDLLFHRLDDVWADRKTIVFVKNVGMVRAAIQRTLERDYTCAVIWGQKQSPRQREEQKNKFWDDPDCRFLIGTTSLERSHNLQCANTVVAIDTQLNPARVRQLIGRSARAGSSYDRIWTYQYMMRDSLEENFNRVLAERQALSDFMFDDDTNIFAEKLTGLELLRMIAA